MLKKIVATLSFLTVAFAGVGAANAGEVFVDNYDYIRDNRTETDLSIVSESELDGVRVYGADASKVYYEAGYSYDHTNKVTLSGDFTEEHKYIPLGYQHSFEGSRTFEQATSGNHSYFRSINTAHAWERGIEKYSTDTLVWGTIESVDTEWGSGHRTSAGTK